MNKCKICLGKLQTKYPKMFDDRHGYPGYFRIKECLNCGFMQTDPQLSFAELTRVYTNYYPKRDNNIADIIYAAQNIPSWKEIVKNGWETTCHFQTKKGQKVLDVGCGTCQSLLEIKKLGGEPWGIDPDKNSETVAKKLKLNFQLGTIHNAKLKENSFDLITASQVLEHEREPLKFLQKCSKILNENGVVILSLPNTGSLYRRLWNKHWLHWHIPYHLNHFNRKSLELLAKNSPFNIYSIKTVTPNLWTVLQFRSYLSKPKNGTRNTMWDNGTSNPNEKFRWYDKVINILYQFSNKLMFVNRIFDQLNLGESFVVTLKKNA